MINKKTILVLASTFPRWKSDTEPRFVYDLCQGLKTQFNIIVLTSHYHGAKKHEEMDGIKVYRYQYAPTKYEALVYPGGITTNLKKNKFKYFLLPLFFLNQLLYIFKLLKQHNISVIHAHWLIPQGFLAIIASKLLKRKVEVITTSHGGDLFALKDSISIKVKKWVIKNAKAITVVSAPMKEKILQLVPSSKNKLSVIPMGTDISNTFLPISHIKREKKLLLFSGRLVEKKGAETLIHALPIALRLISDLKLVIIGDGPEKDRLINLSSTLEITSYIDFMGKISHQELANWYNKATIAIFPFQEARNGDIEGLGLVVIEALACECPVIVGDVPAIHDIVEDGKSGIIFEQKNHQQLANIIINLLNEPDKRKNLAKNGRKKVFESFSSDKSNSQYINLFNNLID